MKSVEEFTRAIADLEALTNSEINKYKKANEEQVFTAWDKEKLVNVTVDFRGIMTSCHLPTTAIASTAENALVEANKAAIKLADEAYEEYKIKVQALASAATVQLKVLIDSTKDSVELNELLGEEEPSSEDDGSWN